MPLLDPLPGPPFGSLAGITIDFTPVPEPSSLVLAILAGSGQFLRAETSTTSYVGHRATILRGTCSTSRRSGRRLLPTAARYGLTVSRAGGTSSMIELAARRCPYGARWHASCDSKFA